MKNYNDMSMVDVAYEVMNEAKDVMSFKDLYDKVASLLELSEDAKTANVSRFYTNLSLDGRFVTLGNGNWDLRDNQTYDKVHIDMNDVYSDMDEDTIQNIDVDEIDEEEKEELGIAEDEDEKDLKEYEETKEE